MTDVGQTTRQDPPTVERPWQSRPVRWSVSAGVLLAAGFAAVLAGAPTALATGIYVVATVVGARFFAAPNSSRTRFAPTPTNTSSNSEPDM